MPRGPCNISVLRECWVHGVIDDGTLVWGQGLIDWLPVKNVRTLVPQIRTLEGTHILLQIVRLLIKSGNVTAIIYPHHALPIFAWPPLLSQQIAEHRVTN